MTQTIKINGVNYPFKYSLGVRKRLDEEGIDADAVLKDGKWDFGILLKVTYECVKAGHRLEGKTFEADLETFEDMVDISELKIVSESLLGAFAKIGAIEEKKEVVPNGKKKRT